MTLLKTAPLFALMAALALPASATRYETDHDADADFASYSSYTWQEVEPAGDEARIARSDLVVKRARAVIEEQLGKKGLNASDAGDLLVEFHVVVRDRVDLNDTHSYHRSRDVFLNTGSSGTAIVDLTDARTGRLVWRGWAHDLIRDGRTAESRIRRGMEKLLKDYPPSKE
jgi:hypothetical protein